VIIERVWIRVALERVLTTAGGTAVFVDPARRRLFDRFRQRLDGDPPAHDARRRRPIAGDSAILGRYDCRGQGDRDRRPLDPLLTPSQKTIISPSSSTTNSAGDVLSDAVGSGDSSRSAHSVMDVLMLLPAETRVLPGHTDETTIGREWKRTRSWSSGAALSLARSPARHGEEASCGRRTTAEGHRFADGATIVEGSRERG
jgi:hypothetical protein